MGIEGLDVFLELVWSVTIRLAYKLSAENAFICIYLVCNIQKWGIDCYYSNGLLHMKSIHPLLKIYGNHSAEGAWFPNGLAQKLFLKVKHPLCNAMVKSTVEGVEISCVSIQWLTTLLINITPCGRLNGKFSTGGCGLLNTVA